MFQELSRNVKGTVAMKMDEEVLDKAKRLDISCIFHEEKRDLLSKGDS